jgi:hypothetical protein
VTSASIFPMGEQREKREPVRLDQRVYSTDYGRGTVQAYGPMGVHVYWDKPYEDGTETHILVHSLAFVETQTSVITEDGNGHAKFAERLEKLPPEEQA